MFRWLLIALCVSLAPLWLAGCGPSGNTPAKNGGASGEHDHGHDHPAEGPHNGHLVELAEPGQSPQEEFHVEWLHEDATGKVTVYILDGAAKKTVPLAAEAVVIKIKTGDETNSYDLAAVDRTSGDKPTAFKFEIESKELLGKLETLGKTVSATVHVDVNGKPYEGAIEEHDHGHEGHKH